MRVVVYTEKSCAVFGDTKPIKDILKEKGGKYNKFLTDPEDGEKKPGWIFSIKRIDEIKELLNN